MKNFSLSFLLTIAPVLITIISLFSCSSNNLVTEISLSQQDIFIMKGESLFLSATVYPSDADNPAVSWTSSDNGIASVDPKGMIVALDIGTCYITCCATDGSNIYSICKVTVTPNAIDLGLPSGTLWAICNVGANSPEEYGDRFAWGETEAKEEFDYEYYNWSTYKYCAGDYHTLTKYCWNNNSGFNGYTDNLTELEPMDDAATINWGRDWQMPSESQCLELLTCTTSEETILNGIKGCKKISKKNGNSIFFPDGYYWSRTLATTRPSFAESMNKSGDTNGYPRYYCHFVRPVRIKTR